MKVLVSSKIQEVISEINKVVIGKEAIIEKVLTAILAKGHILLEDIPGVGKTTLALAISKTMELKQSRMQFTPDVLPADIVGFNILDKDTHEFIYKEGAVFCNLFLADEINRTSSKTQSALLEIMEEGKVTVDGKTRIIEQPFTVIATQNPIGSAGTQMLPESQLDRFMVKLTMGYPDLKSEIHILKGKQMKNPLEHIQQVLSKEELSMIQGMVEAIFVHDDIYLYIAELVNATRNHPFIDLGVSPRGTLALTNMAKSMAFLRGRGFVIPEDVKMVFSDVVSHRIIISSKARLNKVTVEDLVKEVLGQIKIPSIEKPKKIGLKKL